jgi:SSS family solute:Na+ symporter
LGWNRKNCHFDIVVGICLLVVGLSLPYYGFKYIGNGSLSEGFKLVFNAKNTHLNAIGSRQDAIPISTLFTGMMLVNLNYWGVEQFIVQRMISAQNLVESQKGIILTAFGKFCHLSCSMCLGS